MISLTVTWIRIYSVITTWADGHSYTDLYQSYSDMWMICFIVTQMDINLNTDIDE